MDDLIAFLREQLKVDEQAAQKADRAGLNGVSPEEPQTWYLSGNETVYSDPHGVALVTGVHGYLGEELGDHIVRHDPARVLAEVEAKRQIIDEHKHVESSPKWDPGAIYCRVCDHESYDEPTGIKNGWCRTVRLLALPFAGHADFRPEWRP